MKIFLVRTFDGLFCEGLTTAEKELYSLEIIFIVLNYRIVKPVVLQRTSGSSLSETGLIESSKSQKEPIRKQSLRSKHFQK